MKQTNSLRNDLPKLTQKEMESLKNPLSRKSVCSNGDDDNDKLLSHKKTLGLDRFTGEF